MKKYIDGKIIELTEDEVREIEELRLQSQQQEPTQEEINQQLREEISTLTECLLEMSSMVYK